MKCLWTYTFIQPTNHVFHLRNRKVRKAIRTMDRGGAPRASPFAKRRVPGTKGRSTNRPPEAGKGGGAEEATGDEAGDRARSVGHDGRKSEGGKSRKKRNGQGEERLRGAGFGHGGGAGFGHGGGRGKGRNIGLGEAEDQLGGFGRRVS